MNFHLYVHVSFVRDSADRVVGEKGTYEELIACSHEIAASTAQLVAASKVQNSGLNFVLLIHEVIQFKGVDWCFSPQGGAV